MGTTYYRINLGQKGLYANQAYKEDYIGVEVSVKSDLSNYLSDGDDKEALKKMFAQFVKNQPDKILAWVGCNLLWRFALEVQEGDIVLCPDEQGNCYMGKVTGSYVHQEGSILPHRRPVRWFGLVSKNKMSERLRELLGYLKEITGVNGPISDISEFAREINRLITEITPAEMV